jgi:hypothetical protein
MAAGAGGAASGPRGAPADHSPAARTWGDGDARSAAAGRAATGRTASRAAPHLTASGLPVSRECRILWRPGTSGHRMGH